jgi:hypothetical protein
MLLIFSFALLNIFMKTLKVQFKQREEMIEITRKLKNICPKTAKACAFCSRSIRLRFNDQRKRRPGREKRYAFVFEKYDSAVLRRIFRHFEHNSDAHIKSSLVGERDRSV